MAKVQKPCKICGKMFTPCVDCERDKSMFHWRTVACSLECAKAYFEKVELARKPVVKVEEPVVVVKSEETEKTSISREANGEEVYKSKRTKKYTLKNEKESE